MNEKIINKTNTQYNSWWPSIGLMGYWLKHAMILTSQNATTAISTSSPNYCLLPILIIILHSSLNSSNNHKINVNPIFKPTLQPYTRVYRHRLDKHKQVHKYTALPIFLPFVRSSLHAPFLCLIYPHKNNNNNL